MSAQPKLRSVTQIMATARNLPAEVQAPAKQLDPGTTEVVNALFKELQAIFPAWKQAWPDDEALKAAKRSWIKSFVAAGINTLEQIRFGIQKCRVLGTDFAPSSGKFIKLCQPTPEEMGIPPLARALAEALENFHPSRASSRTWSHPAVRHAALQCEAHNLGDLKPEQAEKLFSRAYDITIRMLVAGQPLGDIAVGIGHDSQKTEHELADEYASHRQARLLEIQQIPSGAAACRAHLLAKLNIKRAGKPAGEGV
ncbi:replication protein P [Pseudomonas sp. S 311-6]|uniref:replication protein P n=1 Tax=Pseudomonas TaxID=286 RepID=UPI00209792B7|nr:MULTISPECIES: replication protein P [Pseudomonas]MCO7566423.1 replication protein P [Pseudomonas mosselii]MCO7617451.1 replication protein P [Pseudomonas guariconensis]MCO7640729.1 replication protein P [Pseudomonas sp. S 311-6]